MYEQTAFIYDKYMFKDCDYVKWSQYLLSAIGNRSTGIDLACGTGNMTFLLAENGKELIGIDISPEMLSIAEKRRRNTANPLFLLSDMTGFKLNRPVDFAVCTCDGVNYLSPKRTAVFFRRVFASLNSGGLFGFDVSSTYKLDNDIGNNVFYIDENGYTCLWTNKSTAAYTEMSLAYFIKQKDGAYVRRDEKHRLYKHDTDALLCTLRDAGFVCATAYDFLTQKPPKANGKRIQFFAYKP